MLQREQASFIRRLTNIWPGVRPRPIARRTWRGPSKPVTASPTRLLSNEADYSSFVRVVRTVLDAAADLAKPTLIQRRATFKTGGRTQSGDFEVDVITPTLLALGPGLSTHPRVQAAVISGPNGEKWLVREAEFREVASKGLESSLRTTRDLDLFISLVNVSGMRRHLLVPINVKYTTAFDDNGRPNYDNSGGVQGIGSVLVGKYTHSVEAFLGAILEGLPEPSDMTDYFFLAFKKESPTSKQMDVWISSILSMDPSDKTSLTFNPAQSFPHMQVHYPSAARALTTALKNGDLPESLLDARRRILNAIAKDRIPRHKARLKALKKVRRALA